MEAFSRSLFYGLMIDKSTDISKQLVLYGGMLMNLVSHEALS